MKINKEAVAAAVQWWREHLGESATQELGDAELNAKAREMHALDANNYPAPGDLRLDAFEDELSALIVAAFKEETTIWGGTTLMLQVDYNPDDTLELAATRAGFDEKTVHMAGGLFPPKTRMRIEETLVEAKCGYGCPLEVIWGAKP